MYPRGMCVLSLVCTKLDRNRVPVGLGHAFEVKQPLQNLMIRAYSKGLMNNSKNKTESLVSITPQWTIVFVLLSKAHKITPRVHHACDHVAEEPKASKKQMSDT